MSQLQLPQWITPAYLRRYSLWYLAAVTLVTALYLAWVVSSLPNVENALKVGIEPSPTSKLYDRDKGLSMTYGRYYSRPVTLNQVSPVFVKTLLAIEDKRFYKHQGTDPVGIARAVVTDLTAGEMAQGGSTITQQLARNLFLSQEKTFNRKIKEILLAEKLEQVLTKDEILTLYLNNAYFGEGAYGIGAASRLYLGKPASTLNQKDSALLVGLLQAPSAYDPYYYPNRAKARRNMILHRLAQEKILTEAQANAMAKQSLSLNPGGRHLSYNNTAPYFNRYVVRQALEQLHMDEKTFWNKGYRVYTTLDPQAQSAAERQVHFWTRQYGRTRQKQQVALFSLGPQGDIIAYIGGRDYGQSQFDRVAHARRQAGSLFKVFVYATAVEHGVTPSTVFIDSAMKLGSWNPENYDHSHHGLMTVAKAFARSNNIIAIKVFKQVSPAAVIRTAHNMGVQSTLKSNLSLALGSADVTLAEMTGAFNTLRNNGYYTEPYGIEKIVDRTGKVVYEHQAAKTPLPAVDRRTRDTMVSLMQGVVRHGTGRSAALNQPVAGKTGTSDDYRNAWFIGFTPQVTTGVWVGNDDNSTMPGISGGSLPTLIWHGYMSRVMVRQPQKEFDLAYSLPVKPEDYYISYIANLHPSERAHINGYLLASMRDSFVNSIFHRDEPGRYKVYRFSRGQLYEMDAQDQGWDGKGQRPWLRVRVHRRDSQPQQRVVLHLKVPTEISQWTRSVLHRQPQNLTQWPRASFRTLPVANRSEISRIVCLEPERHRGHHQAAYPWCQWTREQMQGVNVPQ